MPPSRQGKPKPERHTPLPPNLAQQPRADPRGTPEGLPGGGPPRPHTQGKPPSKIPSTPRPSRRSEATPCVLPHPAPLLSTDVFNEKGHTSQGYSVLLSQNPPSQTWRTPSFLDQGLQTKSTLLCMWSTVSSVLFYLFASFQFYFRFFSFLFFFFLHHALVSACMSAQTALKLIHSVRKDLVGIKSVLGAKLPLWMMGTWASDRPRGLFGVFERRCCAALCSLAAINPSPSIAADRFGLHRLKSSIC